MWGSSWRVKTRKGAWISKSKQNEGFVAYDYFGAFKPNWLTSKWTKLLAGVEKERVGRLANFKQLMNQFKVWEAPGQHSIKVLNPTARVQKKKMLLKHLKCQLLIIFLAETFDGKTLKKILRGQEMAKNRGSGSPKFPGWPELCYFMYH